MSSSGVPPFCLAHPHPEELESFPRENAAHNLRYLQFLYVDGALNFIIASEKRMEGGKKGKEEERARGRELRKEKSQLLLNICEMQALLVRQFHICYQEGCGI